MNTHSIANIYQIAGLDDQSRGFNRQASVTIIDDRYQAVFLYEQFRMEAEHVESETEAVYELIRRLQECGYRELRSRLHFRGREYLGNQELWEEHTNPELRTVWQRICSWIRRK